MGGILSRRRRPTRLRAVLVPSRLLRRTGERGGGAAIGERTHG